MGWGERYDDAGEEVREVHVLAVDDNFVDRKVIERLLRSSACKATVVESGRRALQLLGMDEEMKGCCDLHGSQPKVDMVITDYCMPGMTGYELLKRIKESSALREIPVVVTSSEGIVARINRCMDQGAEEFLLKPVKLSDVKRLKDNMKRREAQPRKESRASAARKRNLEDEDSFAGPSSSSSTTSSPVSHGDRPLI
ncbi:hypothetical protein MLD38_008515 [Melastoma candidum]|uniref:Uncharacterized protein n=1 Tax=Melastoma candidum TaxID=119954 RepID=A0ACB9RV33_9MYRT|nr:hypothetical protein MLD38_008515 [Melastoma candidum]